MNKTLLIATIVFGTLVFVHAPAQPDQPAQKLSVTDRLAKARAAKAEKKSSKTAGKLTTLPKPATPRPNQEKATSADYRVVIDKTQRGPNGEVVRTGEKGGQFYINKNGNKTYLKSNQ